MSATRNSLLRQEVEELTDLLRNDPAWRDLHPFLAQKGLVPQDVLLAGFMESEDGWQGGAIVVLESSAVYLFEISDARKSKSFDRWMKVSNIESALKIHPAIEVAISLT